MKNINEIKEYTYFQRSHRCKLRMVLIFPWHVYLVQNHSHFSAPRFHRISQIRLEITCWLNCIVIYSCLQTYIQHLFQFLPLCDLVIVVIHNQDLYTKYRRLLTVALQTI